MIIICQRDGEIKNYPGAGAKATILAKYLHPSAAIRRKWPNTHEKERVGGGRRGGVLTILGYTKGKVIVRKPVDAFNFTWDKVPGTVFYAACNRTKLFKEGPEDEIFLSYGPNDAISEVGEVGDDQGAHMDMEREERTPLVDHEYG